MTTIPQYRFVGCVRQLCSALQVPRATFYRSVKPASAPSTVTRVAPPQQVFAGSVLTTLHSERFIDDAPAVVAAKLLDEGQYLCSARKIYRILDDEKEVKEQRNIRRASSYAKPQLIAERPNQAWSWDITKIKGPVKWSHFYLDVILYIFSRHVLGLLRVPGVGETADFEDL